MPDTSMERIFTVADCHATVWKNKGGAHGSFHTISVSRSYKNAEEETKYTTSFGGMDIANMVAASMNALVWIWEQNRERKKTEAQGKDRKRSRSKSGGSKSNGADEPTPPRPL